MAVILQAHGIFSGIKTGTKKDGSPWHQLAFKVSEHYKGATIDALQMTEGNLKAFPPDNFDINSLQVNQKYMIAVTVGASAGQKGGAFVNFDLISAKPV